MLGQADFTHGSANQGGGTTPTQATLSTNQGLAYDSTNQLLYVGDTVNNRIMVFNVATSFLSGGTGGVCGTAASYGNGEKACYELGQANFTTSSANGGGSTGQGVLSSPRDLDFDGTASNQRLFVAERGNSRVTIWPAYGNTSSNPWSNTPGTTTASDVLGQSSWSGGSANGGGSTGQTVLSSPEGVAYDSGNNLAYVLDGGNNRVMVFQCCFLIPSSGGTGRCMRH